MRTEFFYKLPDAARGLPECEVTGEGYRVVSTFFSEGAAYVGLVSQVTTQPPAAVRLALNGGELRACIQTTKADAEAAFSALRS